MRRQAVTDELTGLANHGRFQALLNAEIEQVRRYHHSIGLIMLDIDDFKAVNDTYGHPQGDAVLRHVARVLQENSRDADSPARYGGEELSLILPHTDLEGAHAIAERIRTAVEDLRVARTDGDGVLRVTASLGVAASTTGDKEALIADADGALTKRSEAARTGPSALRREPRTLRGRGRLKRMGLLDDAIREHLDLKRRRGADPTEIERAEREALGPVRRGPEAGGDDAPAGAPAADPRRPGGGRARERAGDGSRSDEDAEQHEPLAAIRARRRAAAV